MTTTNPPHRAMIRMGYVLVALTAWLPLLRRASADDAAAAPAAQSALGRISGHVTLPNGLPAAESKVVVKETGQTATVAPDGSYELTLAPGQYVLDFEPAGGGTALERQITVRPGGSATTDATLVKAVMLPRLVVTDHIYMPAQAGRMTQEQAPNLVEMQTIDEIRKLPAVTVAEAVQRIPGIAMETDEGEGRYINIRGFDADLNSTTFGGMLLLPTNNASPFGGYRAVALDAIPIGVVGAITFTESNLPEQEAEALGGEIEITPKTAPPGIAPFIQGKIGSGYEPLQGTPIGDLELTAGGHFGGAGAHSAFFGQGPLSVVLSASYYDDQRGWDDVEPAYVADPTVLRPDPQYWAMNNLQIRDYENHRRRYTFGANFGYEPDANNSYFLRAFEAAWTENYNRNYFNINPDGNVTTLPDGSLQDTLNGPTAMQHEFLEFKETSLTRVAMLGGKNQFDGDVLDYRVGYLVGSDYSPSGYNVGFDYVPPAANSNVTMTYRPTGEGHTPIIKIAGADYLNPSNYVLDAGASNVSSNYNYDKEWEFAANNKLTVRWVGGPDEYLKFGATARLETKGESGQPRSYDTLPAVTLAQASLGSLPETNYDGQYQYPPDSLRGWLPANFGPGTVAAGDAVSALQQYLRALEDVYAGYVEYNFNVGKLNVIGGVRVEGTHDTTHTFGTGVDANGNEIPPIAVTGKSAYTDAFPTVQFKYLIRPKLIARFAYSTSLARPGFNQFAPSTSIDLGALTITTGNPDLKPARADTFDFSIEKYLTNAGVVSLDFFDKQISDYIVPNSQADQHAPAYLNINDPVTLISFTNAKSSYARGIEFDWNQRFTGLPGFLSGLGAGFNYTYVDSRFEIRPGEHSQLPSSSKNVWNAMLFYEKNPIEMRLVANHTSADIFGVGGDRSTDVWNDARTSMDFGGSYAFSAHWTFYVQAKNLLNTPHTFYIGTPDRPIQREFYRQTYLAGVRFDY